MWRVLQDTALTSAFTVKNQAVCSDKNHHMSRLFRTRQNHEKPGAGEREEGKETMGPFWKDTIYSLLWGMQESVGGS